MTESRIKYLLPSRVISEGRRRFRDIPIRILPTARKQDTSPVRLVAYFVGGIVLANLMLMGTSALRGNAATVAQDGAIPTSGPLAATAAQRALASPAASEAATDEAPTVETLDQSDRPSMANLCADARKKLITGLTLYYLQRSRRPDASAEEVMESAGAHALLSGPADPGAMPTGIPCAG